MSLKVGGRWKKEDWMPKVILYGMVVTTFLILLGGILFVYKMLS